MVVSSAIIHLLLISGNSVYSSDPTASFMFFLALPIQMYILIHYMKVRENFIFNRVDQLNNILYLHKNLLHQLDLESRGLEIDKHREKFFIETYLAHFGNNGWGILWAVYYFKIRKNYINVHILSSTSRNIRNSWECSVYIEEAKRALLGILKDEASLE